MQKLGKYEILAELGHGAMGVVYKARDPFIGRLVALKTINANLVDRPDLLERFYQEAQSAGKLQHPNIVTIFELGQEKDTPFIAMEYLDGESLEKAIARQDDLPLALKVGYIVRICRALEYAHKNRVVHRDIKPGNIMVNSEGVVKVVDFGIARLVDFSRTRTNLMIGTPAYMAPELFRKKKADERTDIWAVGVTFYELICCQRPFSGDGYDIIRAITEDEFSPISSVVPDCGSELETIIQRMLRKQSSERYQSMEDALLDLEPAWNAMRRSAAAVLLERAREFYELGDLPKAQDTLHRARQIDSSNTQAKSLFEEISAELRRTEIQPKVMEHLGRGRSFLRSGQFREAYAEVEAALVLDSRHEMAQKLAEEVEAGEAHSQKLEQKLRLTKQRLAEGALAEAESALRQAFLLEANHPQALELKRQIGEEQTRRERRRQLTELLNRARGLWTELKYDECLQLIAEGLKTFPNEPELRTLEETARADQFEQKKQGRVSEVRRLLGQRKLAEARESLQVLAREQPQDTTIKNLQTLLAQEEQEEQRKKRLAVELASLRGLVSAEKFGEAAAKGEGLLREFPEEYEIKDLAAYAKGEVAQQEQKRSEEEREKQIRKLLEAHRYQEAGEMARRAAQEFPAQDTFKRIAAEAEEKNEEQQERERVGREIQQRIQEIRGKIKRQELTDAIDLARQTLATLGPDSNVTRLLQAAEVEAEERDKKNELRKQQMGAARALVEKEDFAGAKQLLDRAIANRILAPVDVQLRMLLAEIVEKEKALRAEEQRQKDKNARSSRGSGEEGAPLRGNRPSGSAQPPPPLSSALPPIATSGMQSATSIAGAAARLRPAAPVSVPPPAVASQPPAVETQAPVQERVSGGSAKPAGAGASRRFVIFPLILVVLAGGIYAGVRFMRRAEQPSAEDAALRSEANLLWNEHKPDDALADWKKLAGRPGLLHDEAVKQVSDIEQKHVAVEQLYAQGMRLLYEEKKYPEAAEKFNEVLQMNLWKMEETRREYAVASNGPGATTSAQPPVARTPGPAKPAWQVLFDRGQRSFERKDYSAARQALEQVTRADGVLKDVNDQAQRLLLVIRDRQQQRKSLDQAMELERAGQNQQAKNLFEQVTRAPNGDPELAASATNQLKQIGTSPQPPTPGPITNSSKNPADYGPVLGEVRGLVSQGRWDDADAKLRGVPSTVPSYSDLKQQINNGRREDAEFSQAKAMFLEAQASKNKNALRNLRPFFMAEANKLGRYGGDARNIVNQIDAELREPAGGGGAPHLKDLGGVKLALDEYARALDSSDLAMLRRVVQFGGRQEQNLPELINSYRGQGYALQNCSVPDMSSDSARVNCDAVPTRIANTKRQRVKFQLKLISGRWVIVSAHD